MMLPKRNAPNRHSGVATIEFVGGFFAFWLMCAAWVEMSFMSYVSALGDLAISRAAQHAKKQKTEDFLSVFQQTLNDDSSLWHALIDVDNYRISVRYVDEYNTLATITEGCESEDEDDRETVCGEPEKAPIAIYNVSYDYQPTFNLFLDKNTLFSREMIVIQEYQRETFAL
ncbi:pilus assembly protein [Salinivibrio kushneri]|uniref:pilus assembly protein n=1 Tax=Salinivibrio kushneri TaxID=1908198 RepID=UPI0022B57F79|nr:pilus assembly protein [Salinivibrio kushneri]WBA11234.1 pilus assembly protein [Salinivibrio kushneri]